jgi:hypothetical protein
MWYAVFNGSMVALIAGVLTLLGYLGIRETFFSGPFYLLAPLPLCLSYFWYKCEDRFKSASTVSSLLSPYLSFSTVFFLLTLSNDLLSDAFYFPYPCLYPFPLSSALYYTLCIMSYDTIPHLIFNTLKNTISPSTSSSPTHSVYHWRAPSTSTKRKRRKSSRVGVFLSSFPFPLPFLLLSSPFFLSSSPSPYFLLLPFSLPLCEDY